MFSKFIKNKRSSEQVINSETLVDKKTDGKFYKLIAKIDETNTNSMLDYSTNPKYYSKNHRDGFIVIKGSYDREDLVYRMNRRKTIMTGRQYHNLILDSLEIVESEEPMLNIFRAFGFTNTELVEEFIDPVTGKIRN